jgi:hypothetical protein
LNAIDGSPIENLKEDKRKNENEWDTTKERYDSGFDVLLSRLIQPSTTNILDIMIAPVISMLATVLQPVHRILRVAARRISTDVIDFNLAPPNNQMELTGLLTHFASQMSNLTESINIGMMKLKATYDIYTAFYVR